MAEGLLDPRTVWRLLDELGVLADHDQVTELAADPSVLIDEVIANGIHIHFWFFQLQVFEKDAVQVIVIVLACMSKDCVEIDAALTDNGCKADNFRSCSYNYQKFQLAVFRKFYI